MQPMLNPEQFDILLRKSHYSNLICNLTAGLMEGLGLFPCTDDGDDCVSSQAVHGTAPDIAGKGIANPIALLRSAILMLEYLQMPPIATNIDQALRRVVREGKWGTKDLGGQATTDEMCHAIMRNLH
jgi:isocitrate dehydrogenase (NAD+)